ncbi:MAG: DUF1929 domain-containing protein [Deltaproteobacteria bacterium]|nr:DUF1929 domain-containing protein [Deltaproteobacteria bacterium]
MTLAALGCPGDDEVPSGGDTVGCDIDSLPPSEGAWGPQQEDWSDVGEPSFEGDTLASMCGGGGVVAHHCFLTAVHAAHLPTNQLLVYHGEHDERLWDIGSAPETMTWHPVGPQTTWQVRTEDDEICGEAEWCWTEQSGFPDLFCSGETLLADGSLLVGGGNVTGSGSAGGLNDLFRFDPDIASGALNGGCGFGWEIGAGEDGGSVNPLPKMTYDRWYPTLTSLGDGRVLISGGTSRGFANEDGSARQPPILEIYNPTAGAIGITGPNAIETIDSAPFPAGGMPNYPFMFLLPSGDIFYAGAEGAGSPFDDGRILVPEVNSDTGQWKWHAHTVASDIPGGSAVMYEPGKILKTGGQDDDQGARRAAEWVDLSEYGANSYAGAPTAFEEPADVNDPAMPNYARRFHNLVLLPDGRVVAVGGNSRDNGRAGEHHNNPCSIDGTPVSGVDCIMGCPTACIDLTADIDPYCTGSPHTPDWGCSLLSGVVCSCPSGIEDQDDCLARPNCAWVDETCTTPVGDGALSEDEFCDSVMAGASCGPAGRCVKSCADAEGFADPSMCTPTVPDEGGDCQVPSVGDGTCSPQNNACYATKEAEIWDPACGGRWTTHGEQEHPRMYHSTALLVPDGRVISMGGGHRDFSWIQLEEQRTAEYFEPEYGEGPGVIPVITAPGTMTYGGSIEVTVQNGVDIARATLVRLGSTTHGFDMSQRFVELPTPVGSGASWTISAPADQGAAPFNLAQNIAPPGYYMLFLISTEGKPSVGHYVQVGPNLPAEFTCKTSQSMWVTESSCTVEPVNGKCPMDARVEHPVAVPQVLGATGLVDGFRVVASSAVVHDPAHPRPHELAAVEQMCVQACEAHFRGRPGITAGCAEPGAFGPPTPFKAGVEAFDLVRQSERHGQGQLQGKGLNCDLGSECYVAFDEYLAGTVPVRPSPASSVLYEGQEYRVPLQSTSELELTTSAGAHHFGLTGNVGYSECTDGHDKAPCPFYLGSLEVEAVAAQKVTLACEDGTVADVELDKLTLALVQPAFGVADEGISVSKRFPAGALIFEASVFADGLPVSVRRPNRDPVVFDAEAGGFVADLDLSVSVPCNASTAAVTARLTLGGASDATVIDQPPQVVITTPAQVPCGEPVTLGAVATDPNGDLADVRWKVDGVLVGPAVDSMVFTTGHTVEVTARDARGAATTARRQVQCG